jgi:sterol desaturase/sphingolipid hydroxylase (fatty acid hydroxylase superfamily)
MQAYPKFFATFWAISLPLKYEPLEIVIIAIIDLLCTLLVHLGLLVPNDLSQGVIGAV